VLSKHTGYLEAVDAQDQTVVLDLAATQMNLVPKGKTVLLAPHVGADAPASVLSALDVPYVRPVPPTAPDTILHTLTMHPRARLLILVASAVAILYGLLPQSVPDAMPARSRSRRSPVRDPAPAVRPISPIGGPIRSRNPFAPRPAAKVRKDTDERAA